MERDRWIFRPGPIDGGKISNDLQMLDIDILRIKASIEIR